MKRVEGSYRRLIFSGFLLHFLAKGEIDVENPQGNPEGMTLNDLEKFTHTLCPRFPCGLGSVQVSYPDALWSRHAFIPPPRTLLKGAATSVLSSFVHCKWPIRWGVRIKSRIHRNQLPQTRLKNIVMLQAIRQLFTNQELARTRLASFWSGFNSLVWNWIAITSGLQKLSTGLWLVGGLEQKWSLS